VKMARVLDLYDHPPANGRVICADEFGPFEPAAPAWQRLVPRPAPGAAAGHVQPHRRGTAHVSRHSTWPPADVLPVPRPQAVEGSSSGSPNTYPTLLDEALATLPTLFDPISGHEARHASAGCIGRRPERSRTRTDTTQ
jgi:hypothetical protein